jgi:hypothetical protein
VTEFLGLPIRSPLSDYEQEDPGTKISHDHEEEALGMINPTPESYNPSLDPDREAILALVQSEYPEIDRLSKPVVRALLDQKALNHQRPPGQDIDLNQDWPLIVTTAKSIIALILMVRGILTHSKKESPRISSERVYEMVCHEKEIDDLVKSIGDKKVKSIIIKVRAIEK